MTSIFTLGPLVVAVAWLRRNRIAWIGSAIVVAAFLGWQVFETQTVWEKRQQWQSFGRVESIREMFHHWPWLSLVIAPLIAVLWTRSVRRREFQIIAVNWWTCLAVALIAGTFAQWALAATEIAFVWHRRYNVAALPLMAISFGLFVGAITPTLTRFQGLAIATLCLVVALAQHPIASGRNRGSLQLVQRGEHWRSSVAWVNQHAPRGATVWIDPGLIEQAAVQWPVEDEAWSDYLTFVVRGPYRLRADLEIVATDGNSLHRWQHADQPNAWLITRRTLPANVPRHRFGRVSVVTPVQ